MVIQQGLQTWVAESTEDKHEQPATQLSSEEFVYATAPVRSSTVVMDPNGSTANYNMAVPSSAVASTELPVLSEWRNTFNMRQVTLSNLAASQLGVRSSCRPNISLNRVRGRCMTSTAKSLDVLRQNLQAAINKEFDAIIKNYLENFFQPAVDNIRTNLGINSVSEDHIRDVCRAILEEAKQMYCNGSHSRGSSPYNELSDSETGSIGDYRFGRPSSRSPLFRKRKESDTDSEASQSVRRKKSKPRVPSQLGQSPNKRGELIRHDGPKWDPTRLGSETLFVMGARANKVLGFGQTRGRLYIKHPALMKYSADQEDKEWLSSHNLMPPTGGKAYLMVLEDIQELALTDEYRNNPNLLLHELKGFEAPDFMLQKIRSYVTNMRAGVVKVEPGEYCVQMTGVMTPPPTILVDSNPPTPSEALDLLQVATHNALDASYLRLNTAHHINTILTAHHGLVTTFSPGDTMSALLAGNISDNSQEAVE